MSCRYVTSARSGGAGSGWLKSGGVNVVSDGSSAATNIPGSIVVPSRKPAAICNRLIARLPRFVTPKRNRRPASTGRRLATPRARTQGLMAWIVLQPVRERHSPSHWETFQRCSQDQRGATTAENQNRPPIFRAVGNARGSGHAVVRSEGRLVSCRAQQIADD